MSNTCNTCKNAVFDAFWGEHKCKEKKHVIFAGPGKDEPCPSYSKGEPEESKKNEKYYENQE